MAFSFTDAFEHNFEANVRVIAALKSAGDLPATEALFSHVLMAHRIWILRIIAPEESLVVSPWTIIPPGEYNNYNSDLYDQTVLLLSTFNLDLTIKYVNTKGEHYSNSVQDICYHLLAHSNYHRGQIAMQLRQHGFVPPVTDYIFFRRQSL